MLGVWTAKDMVRNGYRDDATCLWCGEAEEDVEHAWFRCPKFSRIRSQIWGENVPDPSALPVLLARAGVAPAPRL
eukprot:11657041-Alexandrium_andersonii.AAC.1